MQNKTFSFLVCALLMSGVFPGLAADNATESKKVDSPKVEEKSAEAPKPVELVLPDFAEMDLSQKKTVDFPPRTSLDTLEMAPLPGIYETNITGPQPTGESLSVNDSPSEQLLGRLTPDVFQEMAELERDNAFLKLQLQKEQMKIDLENLKSQYRQNRLDEIAKREEVVRSRIQWWQEQEKIRLEIAKKKLEEEEQKAMEEEKEIKKRILPFYENILEGIVSGDIRHGNNKVYTKSSIGNWNAFGKYLRSYCKATDTFDDITKSYADKFCAFLDRKKLMPTTCNKYIICFRRLCNLAAEYGVNHNATSLKVWKERNVHESEKIAGVLEKMQYHETKKISRSVV